VPLSITHIGRDPDFSVESGRRQAGKQVRKRETGKNKISK
jgi:hypothetical protein